MQPANHFLPSGNVLYIADASSKTTGQDRQGMFYAAEPRAPANANAQVKITQNFARELFDSHGTGPHMQHFLFVVEREYDAAQAAQHGRAHGGDAIARAGRPRKSRKSWPISAVCV